METLEKRLQRLEDLQAIRDLLSQYAYYADQNEQKGKLHIKELAQLFTNDGIWEMPGVVQATGKEEIIDFFQHLSDEQEVITHYIMPPLITLEGDKANTISNLLAYSIAKGTNIPNSGHSFYDIDYTRTTNGWKMKHLVIKSSFSYAPK